MGKETSLNPSGKPGPNPSQVLSLDSSFNPWDSSLLTQLLQDNDDDGDEDEEGRDDDDLIDVDDDNDLMRQQNFDLNDVDSMSSYELLRLWRIRRNEAKLASLGLRRGMTSAASPSSDCPNRKKCAAPQDDVERRVQPKRNAKKRHLTGFLTTMSSTGELDPSILLTRERKTLSARECVRTVTMWRSTTRTRTSWRVVSLTHTFCRCLFPPTPTSGPHPARGRKHSSSSPRGSLISIRIVLQGQKAIN